MITCPIRRCSCHSKVEAGSIAEEFTSLLEKFLLLEVSRTFQRINLDVMGHRSAVVVVMLDRVIGSIAFKDLVVAACNIERSLHLSGHYHSSFSCFYSTIIAFIASVKAYNADDLIVSGSN